MADIDDIIIGEGKVDLRSELPPPKTPAKDQKEREAAFAHISKALAKELSGPLSTILSYAQLLKKSGVDPEYLNHIAEQARQSRETLQKLLAMAGEAKPKILLDPYMDWAKGEGVPIHLDFGHDLLALET